MRLDLDIDCIVDNFKYLRALERVFFHDINNILTCLSAMSEIFDEQDEKGKSEFANRIGQVTTRLVKEVEMQRALIKAEVDDYTLLTRDVPVNTIITEMQKLATTHPAAQDKRLQIEEPVPLSTIKTDLALLLRVLSNMLTNGFEASEKGETIKLTVEERKRAFTFSVWNKRPIAKDHCERIFQRHFSTKSDDGRGYGTFSMKLFGERYLGGKVDFTSSEKEGTTFRFTVLKE